MTLALSLRRSVSEVKVDHALSSVSNFLLNDTVELGSEFRLPSLLLRIGQLVKPSVEEPDNPFHQPLLPVLSTS